MSQDPREIVAFMIAYCKKRKSLGAGVGICATFVKPRGEGATRKKGKK